MKDRVIKEKERRELTSLSRSQAYKMEKRGEFPARVKLSGRAVGWMESEILGWLKSLSSK